MAFVTRAMGYDAGIVISASHNPFQDNGIKVFSGRGEKFTESVEAEVESDVCPLFFSLGEPDVLAQLCTDSGFQSVRQRRIPTGYRSRFEAMAMARR